MIILMISYFFKTFKLIVIILTVSYFLGMIWWIFCDLTLDENPKNDYQHVGFIKNFNLDKKTH